MRFRSIGAALEAIGRKISLCIRVASKCHKNVGQGIGEQYSIEKVVSLLKGLVFALSNGRLGGACIVRYISNDCGLVLGIRFDCRQAPSLL